MLPVMQRIEELERKLKSPEPEIGLGEAMLEILGIVKVLVIHCGDDDLREAFESGRDLARCGGSLDRNPFVESSTVSMFWIRGFNSIPKGPVEIPLNPVCDNPWHMGSPATICCPSCGAGLPLKSFHFPKEEIKRAQERQFPKPKQSDDD